MGGLVSEVGGSLGLVAAIGGVLILIVLIYAIMRNRQRTPREEARTEQATRDLYARTDRQDQASDPDPTDR
ncbi:hypothetical protein [Sphingomonas crusticola]|uniref:hypothetical protein n=1 Tax=Sphingomonas crusticola TaxID=1697973 RepID=UPI0013C32708|nr:hypothetical protein [Sphingomonas crusticola]